MISHESLSCKRTLRKLVWWSTHEAEFTNKEKSNGDKTAPCWSSDEGEKRATEESQIMSHQDQSYCWDMTLTAILKDHHNRHKLSFLSVKSDLYDQTLFQNSCK